MSSDTGDLPVIGVGGVRSSEAVPLTGVNDTLINGDASGIIVYRVDEEDDIQLYYPISFTAKAQGKRFLFIAVSSVLALSVVLLQIRA